MARLIAEEILEEEVETLAGKRHSRDHPCGKHLRRWGYNPGSIRIDGEKVPIDIPRLRDKDTEEEHPLKSYQAMKEAGGRLLYRIDVQETRGLYVSAAYSVFFTPYHAPNVYPQPPPQEETEHTSVGAMSLGAEFTLGFGLGVSVEFGGARVWREHRDEPFFFPGLGVGLHYHW